MKISDLKRNLKEATKEDLIKDIVDLFNKNPFVREFYSMKFCNDSSLSILIKHKDIIENEFFPKRGHGKCRLSVAKKAITEFKKLSEDKKSIADLMIFYVEMGVQFTDNYGDIDEPFYLSMESMYGRALKFIVDNNLIDDFNVRCLKIVNDTKDMGWGFHDQLYETYYSHINK
ncbi:DUF6155 family protein [Desulforegula conservatrix]|uniref:DUF6155 family protein n=1 Tax=Desulforegula conservatrix TaxID=153026 RepID=UPI0003FCC7EB|nr:DUF6155 family protein [Desulforegula conservatrix]